MAGQPADVFGRNSGLYKQYYEFAYAACQVISNACILPNTMKCNI